MPRTSISPRRPPPAYRALHTARAFVALCVASLVPALNAQVTERAAASGTRTAPPIYTAPHVDPRDNLQATPYGAFAWRGMVSGTEVRDLHGPAALPAPRATAALIELPAGYRPGGGGSRPHHAIGFRSTAAEGWLREQGIDARQCYLPMLRARARVTPSGEANAAFWVYARCSLR